MALVGVFSTLVDRPQLTRRTRAGAAGVAALITIIVAGLALTLPAVVVEIRPLVSTYSSDNSALPARPTLVLGRVATFCIVVSTVWLSVLRMYGRGRAASARTYSATLWRSIQCWAVLRTAACCLALVASQSPIIASVAFWAYRRTKHELSAETLGAGSPR